MGNIYIKTINGRKYKYERLSSKRLGKKVITKDKYLGAVEPVAGKLDGLSGKRKKHYQSLWQHRVPVSSMVDELKERDGIKVSETTVRKFFKGVARMPQTREAMSQAKREVDQRKKQKKAVKGRELKHRFQILIEEKRITPKQIANMVAKGLHPATINKLWEKRG